MASTARLGISGNSRLGNIELGTTDTLTTPFIVAVPNSNYFTGILGLARSVPSHVVLGASFMRMVASPSISANLNLSGSLLLALTNRLLFASAASVVTQARRLALKVVQRTTTQLDTLPASIDVSRTELYPLSVDFTQYISSGDSITSPSATLLQVPTGTSVPTSTWLIGNAMSISGNIVQVPINTSQLQLSQQYSLLLTVKLNTNKTLTSTTQITVVS